MADKRSEEMAFYLIAGLAGIAGVALWIKQRQGGEVPPPPPPPPPGSTIIADHLVVSQFDQIPDSALPAAIAKKVFFKHASVGEQISVVGLNCLQGTRYNPECADYPDYKYDRRNWNWPGWVGGGEFVIGKLVEFETTVNAVHDSYDVFGMKLCYLDWLPVFPAYRDMMLGLEAAYPTKRFIWATQALSPMLTEQQYQIEHDFNLQVRAFAQANNKVLYDLADIESHDPAGNACSFAYGETICPEYRADQAGHPNITGSIRLAKGFWWLMARVAGWGGTS